MRELVAEFCGTMLLVLLTNGTVATARLPRSHGLGGGWLTIAVGSALAVVVAVGLAGPVSGGHVNPAVTVGLAVWGFFPAERVGGYVVAQLAGGFLGAVLVWVAFWRHWDEATDPAVTRGVFCTSPAIRHWPANLFAEFLGTAVLAAGVTALVRGFVAPGVAPWWVGGLVLVVGLALGGTTGFALNPARDLAPRLAYRLLPIPGRGSPDWRYAWIPVAGPVLGAVVGVGMIALLWS